MQAQASLLYPPSAPPPVAPPPVAPPAGTLPPFAAEAPEFQPLPVELVADLGELPFDVLVRRGPRMVLYARRGAEAGAVVARARAGLLLHVPHGEAAALEARLVESVESAALGDGAAAPRSARLLAAGSTVLEPLFATPKGDAERAGLDAGRVLLAERVALAVARAVPADLALGRALLVPEPVAGDPAAARALARRGIHTAATAVALALRVGLARPAALADLACAAVLHDVAMPRVASVALHKPGRLESREWTATQRHPLAGAALVAAALGTNPAYGSLIAEHHERVDGSGYPRGLSGDRLELASQALGLADAFDAIVSPRAHKAAYPASEAVRILAGVARGRFDRPLLLALASAVSEAAGDAAGGPVH